jgi:hypothetical protein
MKGTHVLIVLRVACHVQAERRRIKRSWRYDFLDGGLDMSILALCHAFAVACGMLCYFLGLQAPGRTRRLGFEGPLHLLPQCGARSSSSTQTAVHVGRST